MGKHLPKDIRAMARSHTDSALNVLRGIMNEVSAPPSARVAAALGILDRGWGRPHQSVEVSGEIVNRVIRAPQVIENISDWSNKYIPIEYKTEQ